MTRLYIRANGSAGITPSVDAGWESSASPFARLPLTPTTDAGDTLTTTSGFASTTGQDHCHRQLIGPPMAAGITFDTGVTYKCYVQCLESAANDNIKSRLNVRVLSSDGGTVRVTAKTIADYSTAAEWNTALRNKAFIDGDAGAGSYVTVAGDRLCVEVGHNDTAGSSISSSSRWGSAGSDDLGENETSTSTTERPWFETSVTLHWAVLPSAIASLEAFGTARIDLTLPSVGGIATEEAFGTPTISVSAPPQTITDAGAIASAEAFGTPQLDLTLVSVGAVASLEAFGTQQIDMHVASAGAITSAEAFGTAIVNFEISTVSIASLEAFGSARLDLSILAASAASAEAFGSPIVSLTLLPTSIGSLEAFGSDRLDLGIVAGSVSSAETFGSPLVSIDGGPITIIASGIASEEAFGSPEISISGGTQSISPSSIASLEAFGTPIVTAPPPQTLSPSSITSLEAFGTPTISETPQDPVISAALTSTVMLADKTSESQVDVALASTCSAFTALTSHVQLVHLISVALADVSLSSDVES